MFLYYIISIILCVIIPLFFTVVSIWYKYTSKYSHVYCPSNVPVLGSVLALEEDSHAVFKQAKEFLSKGNHRYLIWFAWQPIIFTEKIEHAKFLLGSQQHIKKSFLYFLLNEWLNTGLLTSYGDKWKRRRRIITPAFHFSILNEFVSIFEKQAQTLVEKLMCSSMENKEIDIQVPLSLMALESMCETSMGICSTASERDREYVQAISSLGEQLRQRAFKPWLWSTYTYTLSSYGKIFYKTLKIIHDYTLDAINKRIAIRKENQISDNVGVEKKKNICFIDVLIDSYQTGDIDINGIREEVDTFIFEGHDTTSSGLTFCLYLLGRHKEIQQKVQDEIETTEGKNLLEIIPRLEFLDCVFKESVRLYPPVPGIGRTFEEDVIIDNEKFYKGTSMAIFIWGLHRNPQYWENPTEFDPYRFMGDSFKERHPYCYVPFSAGPRNCIGQKFALLEVKICLYYVLKNFHVTSVQLEEELEICTDMITLSRNGVMLKFQERT